MDKKTKLIILLFCILKLFMHLWADSNSGFQGDELLHIEAGNNLAFGYMEIPPLIAILAFIQNLFDSQSVFMHHIFSHIASILILFYVAKITMELGGRNKAVLLVLLCFLIAPGFGRSQQLFQPVVFSQLFWVLAFYQLTRFVKYLDTKYLWYLAITVSLGFLAKYDIVFFILGLPSLFFFKRTRDYLFQKRLWFYVLISLIIVSPNLIWQYLNDFPFLKMMERLYHVQLDNLNIIDVFLGLAISINPLNAVICLFGFMFMLNKGNKRLLPLTVSILFSIFFLTCFRGKGYYYYPIVLTILPFGAGYFEKTFLQNRKWILYPLTAIMLLSAWLFVPFGLPINSLKDYLENIYPHEQNNLVKGAEYSVPFGERYTQYKWPETMLALKTINDSLELETKKDIIIWGKHYAQAGAVQFFKEQYMLPEAFSLHGSFYNWVPKGEMPQTIIALGYDVGDFFYEYFEEVDLVKTIHNPYADEAEQVWQNIYICKKPKQDFETLKTRFKDRIYE